MRSMRRVFIVPIILGVTCLCVAQPQRWEETIQAFEQADAANPPPPGGVLFVGSSSIRLWDTAAAFPLEHPVNRGFGGSQLPDVLHYFDRIITRYKPRTVVLYCGDNDIAAGCTAQTVYDDFLKFAAQMEQKLPQSRLIFISIKPSPSRRALMAEMAAANARIEAHCHQHPRMVYADVFTPMLDGSGQPRRELFREDMLHLNAAGYELWKSVIGPLLQSPAAATPADNMRP